MSNGNNNMKTGKVIQIRPKEKEEEGKEEEKKNEVKRQQMDEALSSA